MFWTRKNDQEKEADRRIVQARRSGAIALDLSGLGLNAIPDSLAQLGQLLILYLRGNKITAIPDSFTQLARLSTLFFSDNQITVFPDSLAQLALLSHLDLNRNQIAAFPNSFAQLARLRGLYLSGNKITVIPDSLAQLAQLHTLDVSDNQIAALPDSLATLEKLTGLYLHGNPDLGIPPEVLGPTFNEIMGSKRTPKPPKEILAYYFAQRSGAKPLNEAKLILVGRGGVGKTSLVKALMTGQFKQGEEATEGIKISDWPCPLNPTEKVTLHIWDFGGQEMMHATHQFFLTARTLYLLVLERRRGGCDEIGRAHV